MHCVMCIYFTTSEIVALSIIHRIAGVTVFNMDFKVHNPAIINDLNLYAYERMSNLKTFYAHYINCTDDYNASSLYSRN